MKNLYNALTAIALLSGPGHLLHARIGQPTGSEYAYIYNVSEQHLPEVSQGTAITFDSHGQMTSGIKHATGSSDIIINQAGTYLVSYYVRPMNYPSSFGIFINDTLTEGGLCHGDATSSSINTQLIIKVGTGTIITLRYYTGRTGTNSTGLWNWGKSLPTASITILKIG